MPFYVSMVFMFKLRQRIVKNVCYIERQTRVFHSEKVNGLFLIRLQHKEVENGSIPTKRFRVFFIFIAIPHISFFFLNFDKFCYK